METVVLLFTDVEGSTRAWASSSAMVASLARHDAILRAAFVAHDGVEFKHTGDGICATFPSVPDAVGAAVDAQRGLSSAQWGSGPALRVRMAVHAGPAHRRGDDWFGLSLSRCARLMGAGHGGQILVSNAAAEMLQDVPTGDVALADLGRIALKDFPQPERVWQVVALDVAREFPPLRRTVVRGNLPMDLSSLVGRRTEIDRVADGLRTSGLVTLTGPGGVGKTRLALAAARSLSQEMTGGAWLVELAAAQSGDEVDSVVAATLGFVARTGLSARDSVADGIGEREILLVLDNCEHVLASVASLAAHLRGRCGGAVLIATSREPLGTDGELVIGVPSLDVVTDAFDLFVARAKAVDAGFVPEPREVVEDICRRLDGIPLAIELAAAGTRVLAPAAIAERLRDHIDVVTAGRRGRIERHATVRAAIDWSWGLLDDAERAAFARLSVFAGRFDLEAATSLIGADVSGRDAVDLLSVLVEKSMVVADVREPAPFRLLEPLRQYGAERLAEAGRTNEIARRHAEHYADFAERAAREFDSLSELGAVRRLDAARDNLRAAFAFASNQRDVDLAFRVVAPLGQYSSIHVWPEPWAWCDVALALPGAGAHPLRRLVLQHAGLGAWQLGDLAKSLALADEALLLAEPGSVGQREAHTLRAYALMFAGRDTEADAAATAGVGEPRDLDGSAAIRRLCALVLIRIQTRGPNEAAAMEVLDLAVRHSPSTQALACHTAGTALASSHPARAVAFQESALDLATASGAELYVGFALVALASFEAEHDPPGAVRRFASLTAHYLRVGNRTHLREFARGALPPLTECGRWAAAAVIDGASRSSGLFRSTRGPVDEAESHAREALGAEYDTARARGERMTDDELVAFLAREADEIERSLRSVPPADQRGGGA